MHVSGEYEIASPTDSNLCKPSQYFLWYLTILPLIVPFLDLSWRKATVMVAAWAGVQAVWLNFAYQLEFLKRDDMASTVWGFSMGFLVVNCWVLFETIRAYRWERPLQPATMVSKKSN